MQETIISVDAHMLPRSQIGRVHGTIDNHSTYQWQANMPHMIGEQEMEVKKKEMGVRIGRREGESQNLSSGNKPQDGKLT